MPATFTATDGQSQESRISLMISKFKQPCFIVITYICFNLTSTINLVAVFYFYKGYKRIMLGLVSDILTMIGFISDACIYVFADRNVRKLLCSIFRESHCTAPETAGDVLQWIKTIWNMKILRNNIYLIRNWLIY